MCPLDCVGRNTAHITYTKKLLQKKHFPSTHLFKKNTHHAIHPSILPLPPLPPTISSPVFSPPFLDIAIHQIQPPIIPPGLTKHLPGRVKVERTERVLAGRRLEVPGPVDRVEDRLPPAVSHGVDRVLVELELGVGGYAAGLARATPVGVLAEEVLVGDGVLAVVVEADAVARVFVLQV